MQSRFVIQFRNSSAETLVDGGNSVVYSRNSSNGSNCPIITHQTTSTPTSKSSRSTTILNDSAYKSELPPPPLVYANEKAILLHFARLFALRHGYQLVINKNDKRRVIMLCSKHGNYRHSSKKTACEGQSVIRGVNGLKRQAKCDCLFRAELQFKSRKNLWLLKPIYMKHNHSSKLTLPIIRGKSDNASQPSRLDDFCSDNNHLNCFFDASRDSGFDLASSDRFKFPYSRELDGIRVLCSDLPTPPVNTEEPILDDLTVSVSAHLKRALDAMNYTSKEHFLDQRSNNSFDEPPTKNPDLKSEF
ncbi:hypothetical protein LJB42_000767 [Komagataella kurtzmanii]|nr:hypothetical protein LJB42_000767 [Komagataella kurtzmanii]